MRNWDICSHNHGLGFMTLAFMSSLAPMFFPPFSNHFSFLLYPFWSFLLSFLLPSLSLLPPLLHHFFALYRLLLLLYPSFLFYRNSFSIYPARLRFSQHHQRHLNNDIPIERNKFDNFNSTFKFDISNHGNSPITYVLPKEALESNRTWAQRLCISTTRPKKDSPAINQFGSSSETGELS